MMDFGAIGKMGQTLEKAVADLDMRLGNVEIALRTGNTLAAMLISELYAARTGHPADIAGVLAKAEAFDGTLTMLPPEGDHYAGMPGDNERTVEIEHSGKMPDVDWADR